VRLKILDPLGRIIGLYRDYLNLHVKVTESGVAHNRAAVKGRARTFNLVIKCQVQKLRAQSRYLTVTVRWDLNICF
jgi:hypothetical protein